MIYRVCCILSQDGIKIINKMETDQGLALDEFQCLMVILRFAQTLSLREKSLVFKDSSAFSITK